MKQTILRLFRRKRVGISELVATLLMIAVTLVAGTAAFGFVNSLAGSSSNAVGNNAAGNINFLNEKEVVVAVAMESPTAATIWVYNSGSIDPEQMASVVVSNSTLPTVCAFTPPGFTVPMQAINFTSISLTSCSFSFHLGSTYTFKVIGLYGSSAQVTVSF